MKKIYMKLSSNSIYFILFLIILTLLSSINLFHKGILFSHDVNFHLHRVMALVDNIKIGKILPVYFNYLNGFGYGNGLFYCDLFMYIPAILNYLGLSLEVSYKIFIIIINFFSIFSMYLCVDTITKKKYCAYTSMILYSCSIYRLMDLVERGALGEVLSFAFLPLVILGIYELLYGDVKKSYYLTIGMCGILFSHVISFYLTCFFCLLFVIINFKCLKEKNRIKHLIINIFISVLLTSHFWLPLVEQIIKYKFNFSSNIQIYINIVPVLALFIDFPIIYLFDEWVPSGIGLIYYCSLFLYFKYIKGKNFKIKNRFLMTLFLLGFISIIFSCLSFIWRLNIFYSFFSIVQFPWRFYMFATVFLLIGFCILLGDIKKGILVKMMLIYTVLIYFVSAMLYSLNVYTDKPIKDEIMLGEYLPQGFNLDIIYNYESSDIDYQKEDNVLHVFVKNQTQVIEVPLIYYDGYKACNTEKCFETFRAMNGLVGVNTNFEVTNFDVYYEGTKVYVISKYISLLGLLLFIIYVKCKKNGDCIE